MDATWLAGAGIIALASFVFGLAGFGIGLVAMAMLPFFMPPAMAVPLIIVFGTGFSLVMTVQLWRDVTWQIALVLIIGTLLGTPLGVWGLTTLAPGVLRQIIGVVLIAVVLVEWCGLYPRRLHGWGWGLGAGFFAGILGSAIGTPGPPVILYAAAQGWKPRPFKAMLQTFFLVNQSSSLVGYWWTGLLTREVLWLALVYAVPASLALALGIYLFPRINQVMFRRMVFVFLLLTGLAMLGHS